MGLNEPDCVIVEVSSVAALVVLVYVITYNQLDSCKDNTVGANVMLIVISFSMTIVPVSIHVVVTGTNTGTILTYTTVLT